MNEKPLYIILEGCGFPHTISAAGNKFFLMAKALVNENYQAILINKTNTSGTEIKKNSGMIEGVEYVFLNTNKTNTTIAKIRSLVHANYKLILLLLSIRKKSKNIYLMPSYCSLHFVFFYWLIARMLRYRLLYSIMEYHPAVSKSLKNKIKSFFFWRVAFLLCDGAVPISHFLSERIKQKNKFLPLFIVPTLADFNINITNETKSDKRYLLYCGSLGYYEVIQMIMGAFFEAKLDDVYLYLVVSGKTDAIEKFKKVAAPYKNIKIYWNLTNKELLKMYTQSIGLLAPMRPSVQDEARFPQKIAEYTASGSPIITNPVGEIKEYFTANYNAIFAHDFTIAAYKDAMNWVIANPEKSKQIGLNGRQMGYEHFNYQKIAKPFSKFLISL